MRKLLFSIVLICLPILSFSQHLVGDVNADDKTNVVDVSLLVENIKTNTLQYSNCVSKHYIDSLFNILSKKIDELKIVTGANYEDRTFENGHEYVDLGLSVKWATCNVGATTPGDMGGYYAWGETETKSEYSWTNYFDSNDSGTKFTKYPNGATQLAEEDDVAHVVWGGNWRMPTKEEFRELVDNCRWIWTSYNGINGFRVQSKENGNFIFIPADDTTGHYWSSTPYQSQNAFYLSFSYILTETTKKYGVYADKYNGYNIRPVCPKE